jgi:hypothetical protein
MFTSHLLFSREVALSTAMIMLSLLLPANATGYLGKAYHQRGQMPGIWLDVKDQSSSGRVPPLPLPLAQQQNASHIFVEISAYRDDLCGITLRELFTHAAFPERIWVGIVDQTMGQDKACVEQYCNLMTHKPRIFFHSGGLRHRGGYRPKRTLSGGKEECPFVEQIVVTPMKAEDAKGPAFARSFQDELLRKIETTTDTKDEGAADPEHNGGGRKMEFCMQIDAHSETVADWDVHMINEWYAMLS